MIYFYVYLPDSVQIKLQNICTALNSLKQGTTLQQFSSFTK